MNENTNYNKTKTPNNCNCKFLKLKLLKFILHLLIKKKNYITTNKPNHHRLGPHQKKPFSEILKNFAKN